MLPRLIDLLIRHRGAILLGTLLLTIAGFYPASQLRFDQSLESLFAPDNPRLKDYLESKGLFGGDEFAIVAYDEPHLLAPEDRTLTSEAAADIAAFVEKLGKIPGVVSVQDLRTSMTLTRFPFLASRRDKIIDMFRGVLIGDDDRTTAVVLRIHGEKEATVPRAATIAAIRRVAEAHDPPAWVVGEPVQVHDMFRYVEQDGGVLGWVSSLLLTVVILLLFRSVRWMVLPLLVVQVTLVWTKAILVLLGIQLSMVSSMLTSLVTIIGVATVMHVTVYFRDYREKLDRIPALRETLLLLAVPIFWVCATTAVGFAAEMTSHIQPVRSFGIIMALGSMLVLPVAALILPGGVLLGTRGIEPRASPGEKPLGAMLIRTIDWVERHPRRVALAGIIATIVASLGFWRLRVETDFTRNFRASSPIVTSLAFVEERLGGAGTWEVNFPAPRAPDPLTPEFLDKVRRLAGRLRELEERPGTAQVSSAAKTTAHRGLTKVVAITDGIDVIPRVPLIVPNLEAQQRVLSGFQPEFIPSLYNAEAGRMRIVLRAYERQESEHKLKLINSAREIARSEFAEAKATGLYVLLAYVIDSLMEDQWTSFAVSCLGITGMMWVAYRSLRIGIISLVPNVLPLVLVIGTMGWLDIPINIGTAMIAAVSLGMTIDSSILYLSGYQLHRRQGLDFYAALRATQQDEGSTLVYVNLVLVVGFLVLTLSHFIPLIHFGILVSVAMLGGLAGNLVLLPLLMRAFRVR